mgnify:CR=1 FL=1
MAVQSAHEVVPQQFHEQVKKMYSWNDVAERTERVYRETMKMEPLPLIERLRRYYGCGVWAGKLLCIIVAIDFILYQLLEWLFPRSGIDSVIEFNVPRYHKLCQNAEKQKDT